MPNILIVDDSVAVRRSLRRLLESRADWKVCGEAENGLEAVDKALQLSPQLIIMDLSMPVMNGLQAAREIHRLLPTVPVLMFTTFANPETEKAALAAGAAAIQSKSDGTESLCESIQNLLAQT